MVSAFWRVSAPPNVAPPFIVRAPSEVNLFAEEKNCRSPVPPPPWKTRALLLVAFIWGFVPDNNKFPEVNTGIALAEGVCEGVNPPTVLALILYPDEVIRWRGLKFSKLTPLHELLICAATSTFRYMESLS